MPEVIQNGRREFTNLVDVLRSAVEQYASRPFLGTPFPGGFAWTTFAQFNELVDQFRAGLASLGVAPGDAVAVISNNRLEWAVGSHACAGLGAAYVPMYEAQLDKEWQYILGDSEAVVCLVANATIARRVEELKPELPKLRQVVNFDGPASEPTSYTRLLAYGREHPVEARIPSGDEIATLIYTSGTTGLPKGVVLTHYNLASCVNSLLQIVDVASDDRGLAFLPWAHVFGGCVELNLSLATGSATGVCGDATRLGEYLPIVKPTILFAVPRVWNKIHAGVTAQMLTQPPAVQWMFNNALEAKNKLRAGKRPGVRELLALKAAERIIFPKIRAKFGGALRFAVSGAAALPRAVGEFMDTLGIQVLEGYGLTETGGTATAQPRDRVRIGSVGVAAPGIRIEIDRSVPSANGDEGEIVIHGANVMRGYYKREKETKEVLTRDGGLRTGDLGRLDADGYLYITGRAKELYKLENGKYVAPVALEQELELSPYIAQSVVFGENKPHNVALIIADVVAVKDWAKSQDIALDPDHFLAHPRVLALFEAEVEKANKRFKGFERIVDFVLDSEELTAANGLLTQTLKLKRRAIVAKYDRALATLYPRIESQRPAPRASYIRELAPAAESA